MLPRWLIRRVQGVAVAKRNEQGARRAHLLRHLSEQLEGHRRDPLSLELRCDQTHGLVAQGSDRDQECDIDSIRNKLPRCFGRGVAD